MCLSSKAMNTNMQALRFSVAHEKGMIECNIPGKVVTPFSHKRAFMTNNRNSNKKRNTAQKHRTEKKLLRKTRKIQQNKIFVHILFVVPMTNFVKRKQNAFLLSLSC